MTMDIASDPTNTICPVCGAPVALDMPPITADPGYSHQHPIDRQRLFRVCSPACAAKTAEDPERFRVAAETNTVASPLRA